MESFSRLRPLLGTFVAVEVVVAKGLNGGALIEAAYAQVAQVDRLMHPSREGSDLARIATAAPGTVTEVHAWTREVLELAQRLARQTEGAFDPSLPASNARMRDIELRESGVTCSAPALLDLGGIAKGFAVDRAIDELRRLGASAGLVNAGGDLRVFGAETRTFQVRKQDGSAVELALRDAALAVSGPRTAASPAEHRGYYHGVSRAPVEARTVAISAPSAALADALCKCALLCEPGLLDHLLDQHGAQRIC